MIQRALPQQRKQPAARVEIQPNINMELYLLQLRAFEENQEQNNNGQQQEQRIDSRINQQQNNGGNVGDFNQGQR